MAKNRWKIELEIYGEENAIDHMIKKLMEVNNAPFTSKDYEIYIRHFKTDFSPKAFFKMCEQLEKKAYAYMNKKEKK